MYSLSWVYMLCYLAGGYRSEDKAQSLARLVAENQGIVKEGRVYKAHQNGQQSK